uniref:Uncharacterized protein n=1 Tax=Rhizophora mucronata TaxID=61149 RepID=A0A2P2QG34_RHIMU
MFGLLVCHWTLKDAVHFASRFALNNFCEYRVPLDLIDSFMLFIRSKKSKNKGELCQQLFRSYTI